MLSDLAGLVPRAVGGRAALRAVGDRLGAVARLNGRTPQELRRLLLEDDMLVLTPSGRIAYEDQRRGGVPHIADLRAAQSPGR